MQCKAKKEERKYEGSGSDVIALACFRAFSNCSSSGPRGQRASARGKRDEAFAGDGRSFATEICLKERSGVFLLPLRPLSLPERRDDQKPRFAQLQSDYIKRIRCFTERDKLHPLYLHFYGVQPLARMAKPFQSRT